MENSLKEIWQGNKVRALREMFRHGTWDQHPVCSGCLKLSYGLNDDHPDQPTPR
jgi:hypothetical protein